MQTQPMFVLPLAPSLSVLPFGIRGSVSKQSIPPSVPQRPTSNLHRSEFLGSKVAPVFEVSSSNVRTSVSIRGQSSQTTTPELKELQENSPSVGPSVAPPTIKPKRPNFGSGPTAKRPGYTTAALREYDAIFGRSHRSKFVLQYINRTLNETKEILGIPDDYLVGILPGSDTGAFEAAMWNMLGPRPVTSMFWDAFGKEWYLDSLDQLKLPTRKLEAPFGQLPDVNSVDWTNDVTFTWNGTTAGVWVGDGAWIPENREGLSMCDATSAVFATPLPWSKLDVVTFSWQKVLGGEGAHGMIILSPRAVERLNSHTPSWPIPKLLRLTKKGKVNEAIFRGDVINTISLLCLADYLDSLAWSKSIGGLSGLVDAVNKNYQVLEDWVSRTPYLDFLCQDPKYRSHTSVTLSVTDLDPDQIKKMVRIVEDAGAGYDFAGYRDAPPGLRIWCGATVDPSDLQALIPWIEWAHDLVKGGQSWSQQAQGGSLPKLAIGARVCICDGLDVDGIESMVAAGCEVVSHTFTKEELLAGALRDFDGVIVRSATKINADMIAAAVAGEGRLRVIGRAGVGVDNIDTAAASAHGVYVVNAPGSCTNSVAELVIAHFLAGCRGLVRGDRALRQGSWIKNKLSGSELTGKCLGLVGYGRIGQAVARLGKAFGMEIHAFDPFLPQQVFDDTGCTRHTDLATLFQSCTHISLHCNLTADTKEIVNGELINLMPGLSKDTTPCGNHIVNCARGGLLHEDDVQLALASGQLASVAYDVFPQEPVKEVLPITAFDGFVGTPHVGANTMEGQRRSGLEIAEAVIASITGTPKNLVNPNVQPRVPVIPAGTALYE